MIHRFELEQEPSDRLELSDVGCDKKIELPQCQHHKRETDYKGDQRVPLAGLVNRLSGWMLTFSGKFCQVDIFERTSELDELAQELQVSIVDESNQNAHHGQEQDVPLNPVSKTRAATQPTWPKLVHLLHAYCFIKLLMNICFQYEHDRNILLLERTLKLPETREAQLEQAEALMGRINASRKRLKAIGAPHINGLISIECIYITILMLCIGGYVLGQLYFRFVTRYDFHLIRAIIDRRLEQVHCRLMIKNEVNKFIESRRNHFNARLGNPSWDIQTLPLDRRRERVRTMQRVLQKLVLEHKLAIRQFKLMAKSGALVPLNRTHEWVDLMSLFYLCFHCGSLLWSAFFDTIFYIVYPKLAGFTLESEPLDMLFNIDLIVICAICCNALFFHLSTCVVSCVDQARLISKVHKLLIACARSNKRIFQSRSSEWTSAPLELPVHPSNQARERSFVQRSPSPTESIASSWPSSSSQSARRRQSSPDGWPLCTSSSWQQQQQQQQETLAPEVGSLQTLSKVHIGEHYRYAQMNANLLLALMHYKIFVVQLRPILKPVGFCCFILILVTIVHPIMIRLHTPYVNNAQLKSQYYIISLITAFFVNLNIMPICYINSRCSDLYNALHQLLAHAIELELCRREHKSQMDVEFNTSGAASGSVDSISQKTLEATSIYDAHSLWSLRRELSSSERFVEQFETSAFGITFTYSSLLRVYFWIGALTLSILIDSGSSKSTDIFSSVSLFSRLLNDPFGFYAPN